MSPGREGGLIRSKGEGGGGGGGEEGSICA